MEEEFDMKNRRNKKEGCVCKRRSGVMCWHESKSLVRNLLCSHLSHCHLGPTISVSDLITTPFVSRYCKFCVLNKDFANGRSIKDVKILNRIEFKFSV